MKFRTLLLTFLTLIAASIVLPSVGALEAVVAIQPRLAKFEPLKGCYIGAFIELDEIAKGDINVFEQQTQKKHASYFTYVGYGRPFPADWVRKVRGQGAAPHIAYEPNEGLHKVQDDEYLRNWARDAARSRVPIFLRWASEMNGPWTNYSQSPALYREKFQLVSKVMKEEAPNVAMVWTPFCEPQRLIDRYYPGDEAVDWVGVNIYSVYVNDGNPSRPAYHKDPVDFLRYVYDNYADRKPVHISEFAATVYCKGSAQDTVDFAIEKMTRFYTALRDEFPRVKSVNWFCLDTIRKKLANNNYSILQDQRVLATYANLVKDEYFLSRVSFNPADFPTTIAGGTTLQGGRANGMDDNLLSAAGAIAANLDQPYLRGLKDGDVVRGDLELRAQLPTDMKPVGLIWQVDGRTMAITNSMPYRVTVPRERLGVGRHTARVLVIAKGAGAAQQVSPDINFEIAP